MVFSEKSCIMFCMEEPEHNVLQPVSDEERAAALRRRRLGEAGIAYSLSALLPAIASLIVGAIGAAAGNDYAHADWFLFLSYLIPQACFAAAALIFFRREKLSPRTVYRGCHPKYFALAILLQFGLMFSLGELNDRCVDWLRSLGYSNADIELPSLQGWNLLPAILIIAVLPAVFEETLFRGVLAGSMRAAGWGNAATVLLSGALFSLFHHNPVQTLYPFVCGMCFALITLRAGSVLPTMAAHFANNVAVLIFTATGYEVEGAANAWTMPFGWFLGLLLAACACLAGVLAYLLFADRANAQKGGAKGGGAFFLTASIGMLLCAVQWVVYLVSGLSGG